jgi:hypothetical protein
MDAPWAIVFVVGIVAIVATLVNSLSLQSGSHPPPLLKPAEAEKTTQPLRSRRKRRPACAAHSRSQLTPSSAIAMLEYIHRDPSIPLQMKTW